MATTATSEEAMSLLYNEGNYWGEKTRIFFSIENSLFINILGQITTGGTIASIQTESGLIPGIDGKKLVEYLPNIKDKCIVDVKGLFNIDSTNVYYKLHYQPQPMHL